MSADTIETWYEVNREKLDDLLAVGKFAEYLEDTAKDLDETGAVYTAQDYKDASETIRTLVDIVLAQLVQVRNLKARTTRDKDAEEVVQAFKPTRDNGTQEAPTYTDPATGLITWD
jgi:Arc/MetJ-type ribon-helix-helix transcriptional regulator